MASGQEFTATELSEKVKCHHSTAFRFLNKLHSSGFIEVAKINKKRNGQVLEKVFVSACAGAIKKKIAEEDKNGLGMSDMTEKEADEAQEWAGMEGSRKVIEEGSL